MGNGPTTNIINEATSVVNNIITSVVSTTDQSAVTTIRSNQVNRLTMRGYFDISCSGGVNICLSNSTDISSQMVTNFKSQAVTQIKTQLLTDITNQNSQLMKIVNGFLSILDAKGKDTNETNVRNMISNYVNNSITLSTIQTAVQSITSLQENDLIMEGYYNITGDQCNFVLTNEMQANSLMNAVASSIVNNFVSNNIVNKVTNRASQTMDVKNEGVESALYGAAALAIACGVFYVLQGIGTRIAAKGGGGKGGEGGGGGGGGSFNKILTIVFVVVIIGIIGLWLYNQYSKKNWPFTPDSYYGCKVGTFIDPATGAKSVVNVDGCAQYSKKDNRGIYKSLQECLDKQTDPSNGTCGQFWGCKYNADKTLANTCEEYPSAYYTINWNDNTKTQVDATYTNAKDCNSFQCPSKWTCATDPNGFAVVGQCRQVTDPFEIAQICLAYNPNSSQCVNYINYMPQNQPDPVCGDNSGANINVKVPLFDTQQECENDTTRCATTWACTNPGAKDNACSQSACPLPCDPNNPNCVIGLFADKSSCINSCNPSGMLEVSSGGAPCFRRN